MQVCSEHRLQRAVDALEREHCVGSHRSAPSLNDMEPNHNLRRAAMPFSRPTSFERHARNFESFQKPRTSLLILFLYASLERNEGRHEVLDRMFRAPVAHRMRIAPLLAAV